MEYQEKKMESARFPIQKPASVSSQMAQVDEEAALKMTALSSIPVCAIHHLMIRLVLNLSSSIFILKAPNVPEQTKQML